MRRLFRSKIILATVLAIAIGSAGALGYTKVHAATGQDCTANSIIYCGEPDAASFINQLRTNDSKNGHQDLQAVYSNFGLVPADYSRFVTSARMGMANRDGTIVVDGRVVATDAWSIGRTHFSYATPMTINGQTYYRSANTQVMRSDIPVMVMFNDKGQMQFAAMTACGNPTTGNIVTPTYSCNLLQKTPVAGQANTYQFTTSASAGNGATIAKVVYDFGDNSTPVTQTSPTTPVSHTYTTPGNFTAKVTVYVNLPGNTQTTVTGVTCTTPITVQAPPKVAFTCDKLVATPGKNELEYTFQAQTSAQNATLTGADFDFGDNMTAQNITPGADNASIVSVDHTYAAAGNRTITATVHFSVKDQNGQASVKSVACQAQITPTVTPPTTPPSTPPATPSLPNTGAGDVIGLFSAASIAGGVGYRFHLGRRLRG